MWNRTLLFSSVVVIGLLFSLSGSVFAEHHGHGERHHNSYRGDQYHHHHQNNYGRYGYSGYRNLNYGFGYRPLFVSTHPPVVPRYQYGPHGCRHGAVGQDYGYGGYGSPYGTNLSYGSQNFGFYVGR